MVTAKSSGLWNLIPAQTMSHRSKRQLEMQPKASAEHHSLEEDPRSLSGAGARVVAARARSGGVPPYCPGEPPSTAFPAGCSPLLAVSQ